MKIHQSQLRTLYRCGEQYRRRYIEGEKIPPSVAAITGTATHKSVEENLRYKIGTGGLLERDVVQDLARDTLVSKWDEGVLLDLDEINKGEGAVKAAALDTAVALAGCHHESLAPIIQPVSVERYFEVDLAGYCTLAGTIDVEEKGRVRDTKTAAKAPSQGDADTSEQLTVYSLARRIEGTLPGDVCLDALVKTAKPKAVTIHSTRTDADLEMQLRRIEVAVDVIERGVFLPTDPSNWWCSARFCGYHSTCRFAKHPVTKAVP